jgi:sugar-specific transcriptional regulator TrmB
MLEQELAKIGLGSKEAKVYLAALELGEANISSIARKSGIKRTTVYLVLESLREKGLISTTKRKASTFYMAENPQKIAEKAQERQQVIAKIMPELLSFANLIDKKPKIRFFEGGNGIKEVFRDTLAYPDQELLAWYSDDWVAFDEDFFYNFYTPQRLEKKIWVRAIFPINETTKKLQGLSQEHLRQSKFITYDQLHIPAEILMYGKNKIAAISYAENLALIIESQKISTSLKSIFEVMWKLLP